MSRDDQTTMSVPKLVIVTADLMSEVEVLLDVARDSSDKFGAVNWGDLSVVDIEYRLSVLHPDEAPWCVVTIEEASPECGLASWLYERLDKDKFPRTTFECEW